MTTETEQDPFDVAFAEAVAEVDGVRTPEPEVKEEPDVKTEETTEVEAKAEPETETEPEVKVEPEVKAEPEVRVEVKPEPKVEPEVRVEAKPEPKVEVKPEVRAKPELPPETPEQKAAREQFEESIEPYTPSDEEKAAIEKMKADFPNEFAAMEARFKATDRDINARVHAAAVSILNHMNATVTPLAEGFNAASEEQHFATLRKAHSDYDTVIAKIPGWIEKQPAYLRPALEHVYKKGTTKDVLDLVTDFKKATGLVPAPTEGVDAVAEEKHFAELRKAHVDYDAVIEKVPEWIAKQPLKERVVLQQAYDAGTTQDVIDLVAEFKKATVTTPAPAVSAATPAPKPQDGADLAPVSSKRVTTLPKGTPDKNDFDSAFDEAVRELAA